jgi:alpha-tubulin suppressor-like RCC1 family protein
MVTAQGKAYPENLTLPTLFENLEVKFKDCSVGRDHMAVITEDGKLMTMGSEDHGKLGHDIL